MSAGHWKTGEFLKAGIRQLKQKQMTVLYPMFLELPQTENPLFEELMCPLIRNRYSGLIGFSLSIAKSQINKKSPQLLQEEQRLAEKEQTFLLMRSIWRF